MLVTRLDGTVTPVIAEHLEDGLRTAEREHHAACLIEMDTPGGLLQSTREIVQEFLESDAPVILYVTPSRARAVSASAYIAMSAHVAAMAPGTHIGAGTPVTGQGEEAGDTVVADAAAFAVSIAEQRGRNTDFARDMVREGTSVSDREAVRTDVVDPVAPSREALLTELDGRRVAVGPQDSERGVDVTNPWGVKVTLVEVKDVELPEPMRRAMARQAEAERDRRAKVIHAKGEYEAAETPADAADRLEGHPAALHLRILSTMAEISAERNSTLIVPLPMEIFRLVDMLRQPRSPITAEKT
ncbi:hypothetical protein OHT76_38825 [Streptomyces sp. NBC_00287]|uniref:SPFH domain-containing protein n=1 Tax=Streptomyces sp. NBC_00287 TaxID=2975702 RepID=UPI002E29EEF7|nr:SPFH domain-containing protein [Streptomyces sp. NBC_00287]